MAARSGYGALIPLPGRLDALSMVRGIRELQQQLFQSSDATEGLAAYVEKRKPAFEAK